MSVCRAIDVSHGFGERKILEHATFAINKGEHIGLIGANGEGKSTFIKKFMESLVSEVHVYEERKPNGQWLKSIKFKLPIIEEDMEICLDNETHVECVVSLTQQKTKA